jgi:hypothetical protein
MENGQSKNPVGRPSDYSPELSDKICAAIASGLSLRTICKEESMPCVATIFNWIRRFPEFLEQYEKAKAEQADALAEEMLDIADDGTNDWMEAHDKDGNAIGWKVNGEHVQRSRLRLDTRKWLASKLKAKKYGDKLTQELTGADGKDLPPQNLIVNINGVKRDDP